MEAQTDREVMMQMNGKIDNFTAMAERIVNTLERLENVKFEGHESRIVSLEKFKYQIMGAIAILVSLDILISLVKYFMK